MAGDGAPPWAQAPAAVLERLETSAAGLSADEAARRLVRHGPNALAEPPPTYAWRVLLEQFRGTVVLLLVVACVAAALVGEVVESLAIASVLVVNAAIGFWTEWRARLAMDALRRMDAPRASVLRDGHAVDLAARTVVPGDVLVLEAGDAIVADARLLDAAELRVNEAPLTGESLPVHKAVAPVPDDTLLADRTPLVFKGTMVAAGRARAVVVGTGTRTEIGRIGELVAATPTDVAPLEERLERLGRRLVWLVMGIGVLVAGLGLLRGEETWLMIETALALSIAAVPEGLPAVATIALAAGMRRMARRRALVRRLAAVETLGSTTVVCTDKTGTLTAGQMTVREVCVAGRTVSVTGDGYSPEGAFLARGAPLDPADLPPLVALLRTGVLANRADITNVAGEWLVSGDPTEAALLVAGRKAGFERAALLAESPEIGEVPFSSDRMFMATFHRVPGGGALACVKGAPERILERSIAVRRADGSDEALDEGGIAALREDNRRLASAGLRVLALATCTLPPGTEPGEERLRGLTLLGHVGVLDPPTEGVRETIAMLRAAGVRTVMLTGDQRLTGDAVARDLGVLREGDVSLDGRELERLTREGLRGGIGRIAALSRVTPEQKLRVVEALRAQGEIVAMLGDGVNDAPALKRAHIGVAMGRRGTDVARETAHLVLQDDRLETVAAAVEEGRVIFDNIRKFIFYLFSCNLSEVLVVFTATLAGLPLPILPLQLLWLNLVTDVFPALALAMDPAEPDVMRRPPRDPDEAILSRPFVASIALHGLLLTTAGMGAFLYTLMGDHPDGAAAARHAASVTFMTLAMSQLLHVVNARSDRFLLGSRELFANRWVLGATVLVIGLQLLAVYFPPLSTLLRTDPLTLGDWAVVLGASLFTLLAGQVWRLVRRGRA